MKQARLQADPAQGLTLYAANLEAYVTARLEAEVDEPGVAFVEVHPLAKVVRQLSGASLVLSGQGGGVTVADSLGKTHVEGTLEANEELPEVPRIDAKATFGVPAAALWEAFGRVRHAAEKHPRSYRFHLSGVRVGNHSGAADPEAWYLEPQGERLLDVVATDGRRLAWQRVPVDTDGPEDQLQEGIVPLGTVRVLERILAPRKGSPGGLAELAFGTEAGPSDAASPRRLLRLRYGAVTLVGQLAEGRFPDWKCVLPKRAETKAVLRAGELREALKRIPQDEARPQVKFTFGADGVLRLENPWAESVLRAMEFTGTRQSIYLNASFLRDALAPLPSSTAVELCPFFGTLLCVRAKGGYLAAIAACATPEDDGEQATCEGTSAKAQG